MEGIEALCKRTYLSDFSLEMNRSVAEYLKHFGNR
jgi:FMN reductase (NADPH)/FMN reductase [NAD(P)H]